MPSTDGDHDPSPTGTDHDRETLERRLEAVERALSEEEPIERADRIDELASRVAELEAAVQALRGYVGSVRAVNEEIELRADRALRKAEAVERNVAPSRIDRGADSEPDAGGRHAPGSGPGPVFGSEPDVESGDPSASAADDPPDDRPTPLERLRERL
jgi:outer membrane murein-binding lipoprotein Lpp